MMGTDAQLLDLATRVGERLLASGRHAVTAESCTGGWIAKALTDVSGSSSWFDGGFVTYSNVAKVRDLGVAESTLAAHGAVSEAVVREMAAGAVRVSGADLAVAVSGVAGPTGGSADKPVGTVWFALGRGPDPGAALACREQFAGDRDTVRRQAVQFALRLLLDA